MIIKEHNTERTVSADGRQILVGCKDNRITVDFEPLERHKEVNNPLKELFNGFNNMYK